MHGLEKTHLTCGGMDWIELAQDVGQVVGTCESSNEPAGSLKCDEFLD